MKAVALLLVVLAVGAMAWEREEEVSENSKFPGKCYDAKRNEGYDVGKTWQRVREPCVQLSCKAGKTSGKFIIASKGCEPVTPKKGCRIQEGNIKQKYPNCCASENCPAN